MPGNNGLIDNRPAHAQEKWIIEMPTPLEIVSEFCKAFPEDGGRDAIKQWFTSDTVWTNVGISSTTGIDEAIAMVDVLEMSMGITTVRIEM